jgi:hypothetical protein
MIVVPDLFFVGKSAAMRSARPQRRSGGCASGVVALLLCIFVGETVGWAPLDSTSVDYGNKRAGQATSITLKFKPLEQNIAGSDKLRLVLPDWTCGTSCNDGMSLNVPAGSPFNPISSWDEATGVLMVSLLGTLPADTLQTVEIPASAGLRLPRAGLSRMDTSLLLCTISEYESSDAAPCNPVATSPAVGSFIMTDPATQSQDTTLTLNEATGSSAARHINTFRLQFYHHKRIQQQEVCAASPPRP